jgi:hypothetical protein
MAYRMDRKIILHLCADVGSDSKPWADAGWDVRLVGKNIGVENFHPPAGVYGVIANPVCSEFSRVNTTRPKDPHGAGMFLVNECLRIIDECENLNFWAVENPATGDLKKFLGPPQFTYEPWEFGSPWTKRTALWGKFIAPKKMFTRFEDVPLNPTKLWTRKGRKPSLVWLHKSAVRDIPEFAPFINLVKNDMDLRSLCSQNFARAFFEINKMGVI